MITFKSKTTSGEIINSVFKPFNFPAGEAHTKLEERRSIEEGGTEIAILQFEADPLNRDRRSIHDDLFQLAVWNETVFRYTPESNRVAVIPYFPAARADRGEHFDLEAYTNFIANLGLDQVIVFDPHSQVTCRVLSGPHQINFEYPSDLFELPHIKPVLGSYTAIIAPDAGAGVRAVGVATVGNLPIYTATKERNPETGKLSNFNIEGLPENGRYLIIDDICDGGGTFIGLAKATGLPKEQLDLYVSHGVFSGIALDQLPNYFGHIFTTNSFNPTLPLNLYTSDDPRYAAFIRFDVVRHLLSKIES